MGTMFAIVLIWFIISIPLSVIGSILASKRPLLSVPVRTNQIPRQIPTQPWYLRTIPVMFISGIFPFGSIAVEMYFIYSSIWFNKIFICLILFFCFILMILTSSLITILMIYYTYVQKIINGNGNHYLLEEVVQFMYLFIHSF